MLGVLSSWMMGLLAWNCTAMMLNKKTLTRLILMGSL